MEGLEVACIVITFGAAAGQMRPTILGAAATVVLTAAVYSLASWGSARFLRRSHPMDQAAAA